MAYPLTFKNWFLDGVQLTKETINDTIDYVHDKVAVSDKEIKELRNQLFEEYFDQRYRQLILELNPKLEYEVRYNSDYDALTDTDNEELCHRIQEEDSFTAPMEVYKVAIWDMCELYANQKLEKIDVRKKRLKDRREKRHFKNYVKRCRGREAYGY